LLCRDRTQAALWKESTDAADISDPIEPADITDPRLPTEAIDPTLPIERTEPSDHSDRIEPREPWDHTGREGTPRVRSSQPSAVPLTTVMTATSAGRTYQVRTYGCQMNVHDSERLSGLLEDAGYVAAPSGVQADVVVFNTCAVRENADNKLYGNLGHLAPVKAATPGMQIAVGGCLAQKDRETITARAPWVDVVFGTHNIGSLPALLERARVADEAQVEILESLEVFPSTLPTKRESAYAAWVSVSVGCNNTCTFCIVPSLRGKEKDRRPGEILAEVEALVAEGVSEITLLGQNVNAYGVEFGDRQAFSRLLRACGQVEGLERVRFTSPHPAEFTDDVIEAMAETPNVMPQLHMPLQSGSDKVLRDMRRSYRQRRFLGIIERVRAAMPEAAITTDIIVGFPGETEEDFLETMHVVREARFSGAFTFQYSKRPGTPAATLPDQVPPAVVKDRYERLVALVDQIAWEENKRLVGRRVELMVAEGEGRKDAATHRLSGRGPDNRLVHFTPPPSVAERAEIRPGDLVTVEVTYAAPHHLVADGAVVDVRRTRSGDAWEARHAAPPAAAGVALGMPTLGVPAPLPEAPACR
jgi:tRNA-2-methylthio-N6-dimethylallyladenosine synthase